MILALITFQDLDASLPNVYIELICLIPLCQVILSSVVRLTRPPGQGDRSAGKINFDCYELEIS